MPSRRKSDALALVEQIVAPIDERAQRLLPRQDVAAAAGEHAEALVEPLAQLARAEHLDARRGELDGERDAVEPPADVGDDRRVLVGQRETVVGGARPLDEERDRRVAAIDIGRRDALRHRAGRASEGIRYVASPAIPRPWRLDARTLTFGQPRRIAAMTRAAGSMRCSQLSKTSSACFAFKRATRFSTRIAFGREREAQRLRDRRRNVVAAGERREFDEPDAVAGTVEQVRRDLQRGARLADAARADERHEPMLLEQRGDLGDLRLRGRRTTSAAAAGCSGAASSERSGGNSAADRARAAGRRVRGARGP